ncbi:hypothetical protein AWB68_03628 [Caballeronia choica]|jgi:hypothetical protein|uniref:Uncharacterized protein n=1 Tax=Caballeronia choica TaxID=326476 RepID=A0A158JAW2_9BURK|nr:hypothetical protein [Caballeronia choica]SAL65511.1 hypothetical protein AWB68_03628 [Caballeronia choica]
MSSLPPKPFKPPPGSFSYGAPAAAARTPTPSSTSAMGLTVTTVTTPAPEERKRLPRKEIVGFDGKKIKGSLTAESTELWNLSKGRRYDSFVGVTSLINGQFHLYPVFTQIKGDPANYKTIWQESGALKTVPIAEVEGVYGKKAIILPDMERARMDGLAHQSACVKAGLREEEVVGWSIKGNAAVGGTIRFVSGRNLDKFVPRSPKGAEKAEKANKESRDLPETWALWVAETLSDELNLRPDTTGVFSKKIKIERVGEEKSSKKVGFRV